MPVINHPLESNTDCRRLDFYSGFRLDVIEPGCELNRTSIRITSALRESWKGFAEHDEEKNSPRDITLVKLERLVLDRMIDRERIRLFNPF